MRYLLVFIIGLILFPLILFSLKGLTGYGIVGHNDFHMLTHWFIFSIVTILVPLLFKYISHSATLRVSLIAIMAGWFMTVSVIRIFLHQLAHPSMGWMILQMNYAYINLFYLIGILISVFFITRIRAAQERITD